MLKKESCGLPIWPSDTLQPRGGREYITKPHDSTEIYEIARDTNDYLSYECTYFQTLITDEMGRYATPMHPTPI